MLPDIFLPLPQTGARSFHAKRAQDLCAGLQAGGIVLFDKAYVDWADLYELEVPRVRWVFSS